MATDISVLGIKVDIAEVKKAIKALEDLSKSAEKTEDSTDKVVASFSRAARAIKNLEQANLAQEKTATQAAKTTAIQSAAQESAANQAAARLRAQARLEEGLATQKLITAKRIDVLSAKEAQASALSQKYTQQAASAQQRANAFTLNQQSLIETRALTSQARITQGAQRLALQQEKFEFQKAQAAERAARRSQSAWDNIKSGAQQFVGGAAAALGFAGIAGSALSVVQTADSMTLLDSRLKIATKSQEEFLRTQQALRESSMQTGLGLEDQIKGFTQLERSTRAMGLSSQQLTFLTESFGKAAVVSGADAASYQSALTQLNQGFASGVIRGQEFNSVAEQAPAIMEALAAGLRGSNKEFDDLEKKGYLGVAALRKLAGEGKLVNSVTIPALLKGLQETNKQFDQMPLTVQRATEELTTAYKIWISDQNNASGSTSMLAKAISGVANNFGNLVDTIVLGAELIAVAIGSKIVSSIVGATTATSALSIATGVQQKQALALAVAEQAAATAEVAKARAMTGGLVASNALAASTARLTVANEALAVAQANATRTAIAANAATSAGGAIIAALGGPIGIAIAALGLLAIAWANTETAAERARKTAIAAANDIKRALAEGKVGEAETIKSGVETKLDAANKRMQSLVQQEAQLRSLISQRGENALIGGSRREGGVTAGEALESVQIQLKNAAQEAAGYRGEFVKINEEIRKFRNPPVVEPTKILGGPVPDTKAPKMRSAISSSDSAAAQAKAIVDQLIKQKQELEDINVLKSTLNEYDKKAIEFEEKAKAALADKKLKNKELVASQYTQLSLQYKFAADLKRQNDELEKRNKAAADFNNLLDKASNKQARNTLFDAVSQDKYSSEAERRAAKTEEDYNNSLSILNEIDKLVTSPEAEASGRSYTDILSSSTSAVLAGASGLTANETTLKAQEEYITQLQSLFAIETAEWQKLQDIKLAIQKKGVQEAEALNLKQWNNMLAGAQAGTSGIMSLLDAFGEKQSSTYKTMFAINKAFAIAQATINAYSAISKGWATGTTVFDMFSNAALIASNVFPIISQITSVDANFAKGAAFSGAIGTGSDVLTTPTTFPMSGGRVGRAGEVAGSPEAIMPLSRDANGRLGVSLNGGQASSGGVVQTNQISITVQSGENDQQTASTISRELLKTMEAIAKNQIVQAKRPGGALA